MIHGILAHLANMPLATAIREGDIWFPWLETVHVLAVTLVLGTIITVDLRLIGLRGYRVGRAAVIRELVPWTWAAFALAVVSGSALFVSKAETYADNTFFRLKMAALLAAGINMAVFHLGAYRTIGDWDLAAAPPLGARMAGGISLACWLAVLCCGRWIGFTLSNF